jgi:hypothetical protein
VDLVGRHTARVGGVDAVVGRHSAALVDEPDPLARVPLSQVVGEPPQVLAPIDVRVVQVPVGRGGPAERFVGVRQVVRVRPQRADRDVQEQHRRHGGHPPPSDGEHAGRGDRQEHRDEDGVPDTQVARAGHRRGQQHGRRDEHVRCRGPQPGDGDHRDGAGEPQREHPERSLYQQCGRQVVPERTEVLPAEQEAEPRRVLEAELDAHPVPVWPWERQPVDGEPAEPVYDRQVLRRRPAQPRIDGDVGGPDHADGEQRHAGRRRGAVQRSARRRGAPDRQNREQDQHWDRRQRAHLRGQGRAEREPGEREVGERSPPRSPHQPDRRQQEARRGHVEGGQRPVRDEVGRERVQRERHQPANRSDQVPGEREDHQPEQQRQHDHRQSRQQGQPPRVVARLIQQMPPDRLLGAHEGGVEARVREREPAPDDQLAQRRVLGVVPQAVLLHIDRCRAHVDGLVYGRRLLPGRRDHRDRHLGEQRDHGERQQPSSAARVFHINPGRGRVRSAIAS